MGRPKNFAAGMVELLRPPNVFTAVADSLAGLALARQGALRVGDPGLWCLPASACLYLGGMALNDFFDREVDARERPARPIPSGAVPAAAAAALGGALLGAGLLFASIAAPASGALALLLAAAIVLYDGALKGTPAGFVNMGACRGINFLVGASPGIHALGAYGALPPLFLFAYVATVTYLSRDEVGGNTLERARRAITALAVLAALILVTLLAWRAPLAAWILFAGLAVAWSRLYGPLRADAGPARTGRAIGGSILLIPIFDATFVAGRGFAPAAIAIAALSLPALWLKRFYSPT